MKPRISGHPLALLPSGAAATTSGLLVLRPLGMVLATPAVLGTALSIGARHCGTVSEPREGYSTSATHGDSPNGRRVARTVESRSNSFHDYPIDGVPVNLT